MDRTAQPQKSRRTVSSGVFAEGQVVASRYRVLRRVGGGAFGTVYEVEHLALGKRFALKVLNAQSSGNQRTIARFRAEAITASRIEHPNIVSVTDFGRTENGLAYFVMELLHGETLSDLLRRERVLRLSRAIPILAATSHGLEAAHQAGVIHRDLKPENIFLVPEEEPHLGIKREIVRILDFGLAKVLEAPTFTMDGITYGTPGYMAPEQIRGERVDARADIYSIGCIAYEMFAGKPVFKGTPLEVALAHCDQEPPELVAAPTSRMKAMIERCLRKDPATRFGSCKEILGELRELAVEFLTPDGKTRSMSLDAKQLEQSSKDSYPSIALGESSEETWWEEFSSIARRMDEETGFTSAKTGVSGRTPASELADGATLVDHSPFDAGYADSGVQALVVDQPHTRRRRANQGLPAPVVDAFHPFEPTLQVGRHEQAAPASPLAGKTGWLVLTVGLLTVLLLLAAVIYQLLAYRRSGTLVLEVEPDGAEVSVNGEVQPGSGGVRALRNLPAGEALVQVSHAGCATQRQVVRLEPVRSKVIPFKLECR